jgi:glutathione S-transferase
MTVLKILGRRSSSNVQKVLWCCGELNIPFAREDIGGEFGGNHSPEYLALNPNALVPTIIDNGFVLWESNAIVRYLAGGDGASTLYPTDAARRADADRWMDWQQTTLGPHMGILYRGWLKSPPDAIDPAQMESARDKAASTWKILDAQLAKRAYVTGPDLTVADIALGNAVHRWFRLPIERAPLPNLDGWYGRLRERPSYQEHIAWF